MFGRIYEYFLMKFAMEGAQDPMNQAQSTKWMSNGEAGLAAFFSATTILCLIAAVEAVDTPFAFHATLGAAASLWAVFAIVNRYFDRPYAPVPQEINGRPNYNLGPIKFASAISVFWGIAGFTVGLLIACQLAWPALNFDLQWTSFGRLRPLTRPQWCSHSAAMC